MSNRIAPLVAGLLATLLAAQKPEPAVADTSSIKKAAQAAVESQDWDTAIANFKKLTEATPKDGQAWHMLGYCLHAAGKLDEALPIHLKAAEFPQVAPTATYNAACVYALKGDKDKALTWLEKAAKAGFRNVDHLDGDSDMDALRNDPRFVKLREQMAANASKGGAPIQAFAVQTERKGSRIALFGAGGSPAQVAVDFGPVPWKDDYSKAIDGGRFEGKKWRFGGDFWTSLDTSVDLTFGGTKVPAGYYYLTIERRDGQFLLGVHDAQQVKAQRLDPFMAHKLQGGIEVPLEHATSDTTAKMLDVEISMADGGEFQGTFDVRFGPHRLSAPLQLHVGDGKDKDKGAAK